MVYAIFAYFTWVYNSSAATGYPMGHKTTEAAVNALIGASMSFNENLRRCRLRMGWTQGQAAKQAGVPFRSYQNWESGARIPAIDVLPLLAAAFAVTFDELLDGVSYEKSRDTAAAPGPDADGEPERPKGKGK